MHRRIAIVMVAFVAVGFVCASGASADSPPQNRQPTGRFWQACYSNGGAVKMHPNAACDEQAVNNINAARATEGVGAIVLPGDYASLTLTQQEIAVSNLERTARGLSALPEKKPYDKAAKQGADAMTDPTGPAGHGWGSIWAGVADPLAADYLWMYDDGPGGVNEDCVNPGDPGCWGHRDNILGGSWTSMGAGHDGASLAELFVQ